MLGQILVHAPCGSAAKNPNPIVTIDMGDLGLIEIELYPDIAPNTVSNFISLVKQGFYDGLTFHRVVPGFVIQGGDPAEMGQADQVTASKGVFPEWLLERAQTRTRGYLHGAEITLIRL